MVLAHASDASGGGVLGARLEVLPLHALQHTCFVAFGMLMWVPVFGPLPKPAWWRNAGPLAYVAIVRLFGTAFGNVLIWSGTAFYPGYADGEAAHHLSPLTDQGIAGAIMMGEGMFVTLGVMVWLFIRAAREVEQRQRLLDLADAHGFPLDERRAARAFAAARCHRRSSCSGSAATPSSSRRSATPCRSGTSGRCLTRE